VQKVSISLNEHKFSHIKTFECLIKNYTSKNRGYLFIDYSDNEEDEQEKVEGDDAVQPTPEEANHSKYLSKHNFI